MRRAVLAGLLMAASASAQDVGAAGVAVPLGPGRAVRFWSPARALERREATVMSSLPETLVVRLQRHAVARGSVIWVDTLPLQAITRLQVRSGRDWGKLALHTLGGAALLGGLGAMLGDVGEGENPPERRSNRLIRRSTTQLGILMGAVLGGGLGLRASVRWIEVPLRRGSGAGATAG